MGYYSYEDRESPIKDDVYLLERLLTHTAIFVTEIKLKIRVELIYDSSGGKEFFDILKEVDNLYDRRLISNEDAYELIYYNLDEEITDALKRDINKPKEEKFKASLRAEKFINRFVNELFDQYAVFGGSNIEIGDKKQYVEGQILKVKIDYSFPN